MNEEIAHGLFITTTDGCRILKYVGIILSSVHNFQFTLQVAVTLAMDVERVPFFQFDVGASERCAVAEHQVYLAARDAECLVFNSTLDHIVAVGQSYPVVGMAALQQGVAKAITRSRLHLFTRLVPRAHRVGDSRSAYRHFVAVLHNADLAVVAAEEGRAVNRRVLGLVAAGDVAESLSDAHTDVTACQCARYGDDAFAAQIDVVLLTVL